MVRFLIGICATLAFAIGGMTPANAQDDTQDDRAEVAGLYDGREMEVAAMLELGVDGRFRYQLAYGALDEWSGGVWTREKGAIVLRSEPFVAPVFEFSTGEGRSGDLSVKLSLPDGYDPQYFAVTVHRKDGSASFESMGSGSLVIPMGDNPVVSLRPLLPVMDLLGPEFAVPPGGAALNIAFKPNDIGFVGFSGESLPEREGAFELARHGLTVRFRKVR